MKIPLGEFAPDVAELDSGALAVAKNAYPIANGYIPMKSLSAYSAALATATPKGLFLAYNIANSTYEQWAATTTKIYQLGGTTWTDRSGAKTFAVPSDEFVSATQFGSKLIFTNFTDGPYVVDVDSGTNVAALAGTPPTGRSVDVIDNHVMLASTANDPYEVQWSDTGDETNWSTGNSGSRPFRDGGRPLVVCGAASMIVQDRGITRVVFAPGSSSVFEFYKIEDAKGTIAPRSVIKFGPDIAYLAEDGFWFKGEPIGHERVSRAWFSRANSTQISTVIGTFDRLRPVFYWFMRTSSTDTTYTQGMMYNWHLQRWAELEFDIEMISSIATPGVSPDAWSVSPDAEPISPDSRLWSGSAPLLAGIDTADKLGFFDGANLEATFETGEATIGDVVSAERQQAGNRRGLIRAVRPDIDTSSAVMNIRNRQRLADTGTWLAADVSMQSSGFCYFKKSGRLFRFRLSVPSGASWSYAKNIDVVANRGGWK